MSRFSSFIAILMLFSACSYSQQEAEKVATDYSNWVVLTQGMEYREMSAPQKSFIGDSKISILRMDPQQFRFDLFSATQHDSISRNLYAWADTFDLLVSFNAGMYNLAKPLQSRAYLQNGKHYNNPNLLENFNLMLALGPKANTNRSNIEILDLTCANWNQEQQNFTGFAQGLRMIDCLSLIHI